MLPGAPRRLAGDQGHFVLGTVLPGLDLTACWVLLRHRLSEAPFIVRSAHAVDDVLQSPLGGVTICWSAKPFQKPIHCHSRSLLQQRMVNM